MSVRPSVCPSGRPSYRPPVYLSCEVSKRVSFFYFTSWHLDLSPVFPYLSIFRFALFITSFLYLSFFSLSPASFFLPNQCEFRGLFQEIFLFSPIEDNNAFILYVTAAVIYMIKVLLLQYFVKCNDMTGWIFFFFTKVEVYCCV